MERVSVVGCSGVGKSTFARDLAQRLGVPHVELDAIFHLPDWEELPLDEFRAAVTSEVARPAWIVDGNYSQVQDLVWERADTVIWLDHSRPLVMRRVVPRTVGRVLRRTELWNGNREPWSNLWSRDPNMSIIAWAWTTHAATRERYELATSDPTWSRLQFIRLRTARDARALLASATS
jgi:adenylate kinase family enzyme